jgi:membrane fusion protein (multidrug efflux system)
MKSVLHHLCKVARTSGLEDLSDAQLLEAFFARREGEAFAVLLRRHGPMVLGVCRRVLRSTPDAEDAFQATFLVFLRKAGSLRSRELVASWLYGVAYRTAMNARKMNRKRQAKEKLARARPLAEPAAQGIDEERLAQLDYELNRLPDKYRVPIVLCELDGTSRRDAARLLGLPEGTLSWRLAQAKKRLAGRLARYGTVALATLLADSVVTARPSPLLLQSTANAVLTAGTASAPVMTLTQGVLKAMALRKLRMTIVAAGLMLLTGIGAIGLTYRATAQQVNPGPDRGTARLSPPAADELEAMRLEIEALRKELRATRERVKALQGGPKEERPKIMVASPQVKDVTVTQQYVGQIRSHRHINVRALANGYLQEVLIKEGQAVKQGEVMFKIVPTLYQARYDAELAEVKLAEIELNTKKKLFEQNVVSSEEVALHQVKLEKAKARAKLAEAELNFTSVKAPFDGLVGRLNEQVGSLINERDVLTTLSDNRVVWVYFNVPETHYLDYKAGLDQDKEDAKIELVLANGNKFPKTGKIGAIEAQFNNETGSIPFRADFDNANGLLRHGQRGTVLIHRTLKNALVIPRRAVFEGVLEAGHKRFVYVLDKEDVAHKREIVVQNELEDAFVIKKGLEGNDRIVVEGVRQVKDGAKVELGTPK